jgi:hypothetical protein
MTGPGKGADRPPLPGCVRRKAPRQILPTPAPLVTIDFTSAGVSTV